MADWIVAEDQAGVTVTVHVISRARRSQVAGVQGDALRVRIAAPPVEGAANEALIAYLAAALGVRRRDVRLLSGERGRRKRVRIEGLSAQTLAARLLGVAAGAERQA